MPRTPPSHARRRRRGAEAVEFALVIPVLIAMVFGALDYGMYFWQRLQVTYALQDAVRIGAMVRPSDEEIEAGAGCAACVDTVAAEAAAKLEAIGADPDRQSLTPDLVKLDGVCVLDLHASVAYEPVVGLVAVPDHYAIRVRLAAQGAKDC